MIIKRIRLENIRSFVNQEIEFPIGKALLSGDIGSGKSSILLAIDFALFGLSKGNVNGAGLLRNGEDNGRVELEFEIDGRNVVVKRGLKRGNGITQDSGSIIINREEKEMTALELRQAVLSLLNYPKEYLTKSKSLIYRYTVYTPQEEMKAILTEGKDLRLDTLRKVFGIDKYKRIRDNAKILMDDIRIRKREYGGMIVDLDSKKHEKNEVSTRLDDLAYEVNIVKNNLDDIEAKLEISKGNISKLEEDVKKNNETRSNIALTALRMENIKKRLENAKNENVIFEDELRIIADRLNGINAEDLKKIVQEKNNQIKNKESRLKEIYPRKAEASLIVDNSSKNKMRIQELSICPVCMQEVRNEHKSRIVIEEENKINEYTKVCEQHMAEINMLEMDLIMLKQDVENMNNRLADYNINMRSVEEKDMSKERNIKIIDEGEEEINKLIKEDGRLKNSLKGYEYAEKMYKEEKDILDSLIERHREVYGRMASLNADKKMIEEMIRRLDKEIKAKEGIMSRIARLDSIRSWIEDDFNAIIEKMERSVMLRVYSEFDSMFRKWVEMLVKDDNLRLKLDEEFSPRIEQNGHDIDYDYLSGGEKTAVALAYRLALNNVINSVVSQIKTNDIIILDEPTDGFSDEQLDRMRDVLDELKVKQLIIVSHENKIESFVDNIIRLRKDGHVSSVVGL